MPTLNYFDKTWRGKKVNTLCKYNSMAILLGNWPPTHNIMPSGFSKLYISITV